MNNHYKRLEQIYLIAPYNVALYNDTSITISEGRGEFMKSNIDLQTIPGYVDK
jgi:hypothetical protein